MCGRFTLTTSDVNDLARELAAEVDAETARIYRPRWNVAPTQIHPVVQINGGARRLLPARFGIERRGGLVINAGIETAVELRTFRDAYRNARCVVPADGFYEWQGNRGDRQPLWFHDPAGGLLLFAGLLFETEASFAFVVLTTQANSNMAPSMIACPPCSPETVHKRGSRAQTRPYSPPRPRTPSSRGRSPCS